MKKNLSKIFIAMFVSIFIFGGIVSAENASYLKKIDINPNPGKSGQYFWFFAKTYRPVDHVVIRVSGLPYKIPMIRRSQNVWRVSKRVYCSGLVTFIAYKNGRIVDEGSRIINVPSCRTIR